MRMAVVFDNVTKAYADECGVFDLSFKLNEGSVVGLLGRNGAGKTTTIKLLMNLIHQNSGDIRIFSKQYSKNEKKIKEDIGFVYEDFFIYPKYNVKNINDMMRIFYKKWDEKLFFQLVKELDIPSKKLFYQFSKGNKMKTSIAVAISHHAKLLVLDEPTSGLDAYVRDFVLNRLKAINEQDGATILFSSHITSDIENIAEEILVLEKGRLIKSGRKKDFINDYISKHSKAITLEQLYLNWISEV